MGLLLVEFTATVAVPWPPALCGVVLDTAVCAFGPDAVRIAGKLATFVCHFNSLGVGDECTGISTLYHNPDLGLIYIIANKLNYVNRSCSNCSIPL